VEEIHHERNPIFPEMRGRADPTKRGRRLRETNPPRRRVLHHHRWRRDRMGIGDENGRFLNQLR
jgi:hypothetical protein